VLMPAGHLIGVQILCCGKCTVPRVWCRKLVNSLAPGVTPRCLAICNYSTTSQPLANVHCRSRLPDRRYLQLAVAPPFIFPLCRLFQMSRAGGKDACETRKASFHPIIAKRCRGFGALSDCSACFPARPDALVREFILTVSFCLPQVMDGVVLRRPRLVLRQGRQQWIDVVFAACRFNLMS